MTADVHSLAGAYALDALPPDEREDFERHLAACPDCQAEVRDFLATTGRLAAAVPEPPPPALRQRVLAQVDVIRQEPPLAHTVAAVGTSSGWRRALAPLTAAAAAVVLTLAVVGVVERFDDGDDVPQAPPPVPGTVALDDAWMAVLTAPDVRTVPLDSEEPIRASLVHAPSLGEGVLAIDGLEQLDDAQYVLWVLRDGTPERVTSLEPVGDEAAAVVVDDLQPASGIAVTIEPPGQDPLPSGPMVVQGTLG